MRLSIELVPRTAAALTREAEGVAARYPRIDTMNVPDVAQCELSSVAAAEALSGVVRHRIPHLRARDIAPDAGFALIERLEASGITEAIVVAGDVRSGTDPDSELSTPTALLRFFARHAPWLQTYAALDPHRLTGAALARNIDGKLAAGATGFFSQPLYDLNELERCAPLVGTAPVFWGLSPVTSARSQRYWERVNHVRFPIDFEPTLAWSHALARRFMREVDARGGHLYLMPIKVDLTTYLEGLALAA